MGLYSDGYVEAGERATLAGIRDAELCRCRRLHAEGLIPMLDADTATSASNRVYREIGFLPKRKMADIRFR